MDSKFVSRSGEKLEFALDYFKINVKGKVVADFGSSTGGFVDCLLQKGAKTVYSVDTAEDMLKDSLMKDERVEQVVANAMHIEGVEVDFISIDVGWTKQKHIIPNALRNLKVGGDIISLIKPQYEAQKNWVVKGKVEEKFLERVITKVKFELHDFRNMKIMGVVKSPIKGIKGKNVEFLMWIKKLK